MNKTIVIEYKRVCGSTRAYPVNDIAYLFLDLIRVRPVKTFTFRQVETIKVLAALLEFKVREL